MADLQENSKIDLQSNYSVGTNSDPKNMQELNQYVQSLLQQMQDRFQTMSDQIINRNLIQQHSQQPLKMPMDGKISVTFDFIYKIRQQQRTRRNNPRNSDDNSSSKCRESFNSKSCFDEILDEMGNRIDDMEKNIADLMTQAGVEGPEK